MSKIPGGAIDLGAVLEKHDMDPTAAAAEIIAEGEGREFDDVMEELENIEGPFDLSELEGADE